MGLYRDYTGVIMALYGGSNFDPPTGLGMHFVHATPRCPETF